MSIEYVLMLKTQQVCLFKIPPISTAKGHYLDDWKEMFWEGGCKLTERGGQLTLHFIDKNTQAIQTSVLLPEDPFEALQKTVDSQRGYAVRLTTPTGAYQWVGCVFRDRNDAFDLNDKIIIALEQRDRERNPQKYKDEFKSTQDFSLKEGEKILISFGGTETKKTQKQAQANDLAAFKFEAPPDFSNFSQPPQPTKATDWGNFGDFGNFSQPAPKQQPQQPQYQQQPYQQQQNQQATKPAQNASNVVNLLDL